MIASNGSKTNTTSKAALLAVLYAVIVTVPLACIGPGAPAQAAGNEPADKNWLAVAPGRVEPVSGTVKLAAPVIGVIDKVLVKAGDTVAADEPLIRLNDSEARAQLASAEAQVDMRKRVRNKEAPSSSATRRRAEDAVADAETAVYEARALFDKTSADKRAGQTNADVDAARTGLTRAEARLSQQNDELRRATDEAPLPTVSEGEYSVSLANLQAARAGLQKLTIRAPTAGTVLQVNARRGELASPSATPPLVLLGDVSALRVRAEADERDIDKIKAGQTVVVRSAAFRGRDMAGKVASVAPLVEQGRNATLSQRNLTDVDVVEVLIDLNEPGPLVTGMKVDVYFQKETASQ
ncbi:MULTISPECIES: HlyD family secretion protein [unclassified Bradyrhizobium]|uniref:HlyD family secretion protein n=1 Tax=unclassified Bradyrhizobium TaxID=2631580 RepID=UPI0028E9D60E|nr:MULTISPECIES: efflux RND transporter periplasmic adaptor subunit [unclassified Bradyrhizobium]